MENSFYSGGRAPSFTRQPFSQSSPVVRAVTLLRGQAGIGQNSYMFMLKENPRGRFLQITEKTEGGVFGLIIPAPGLPVFKAWLDHMVQVARRQPEGPVPDERDPAFEPLTVERKTFLLQPKETPAGRFYLLSEQSGTQLNDLFIPAEGLVVFQGLVHDMVRAAAEVPMNPALQPRPQVEEHVFKSVLLPVERKSFMLALKESPRGRYLLITEKSGEHFNCMIVAAAGFADFKKSLDEIMAAADQLPPASAPLNPPPPSPVPAADDTLQSTQMQVGDKAFIFLLKENQRGRFLRLVEVSANHEPKSIIIPASGLAEFHGLVREMVEISAEHPESIYPPARRPGAE